MSQMSKEVRDMIIEEDLGWLEKLQVHEVNGKLMLGDFEGDLPINVSHIMDEAEFASKWLLAFALGNCNGKNYFPLKQWFELTFNGTRAVLVVKRDEDTGEMRPALLVPPIISVALTEGDRDLLRKAAALIYVNSKDTMKANNMNANMEVAQTLADERIGLKAKPTSMSDLINPDFYAKYNIIPEVERKVYYIRDVVRGGQQTEIKDLNKAREVLYRDHKGEAVSKDEYKFLHDLTLGHFIIEGKVDKAPVSAGQDGNPPATPANPWEC